MGTESGRAILGLPMPPLRRLRERRGLSLRDLATLARVSVSALLDVEHRRRQSRPSTKRKIAAALGVAIPEVEEFNGNGDHGPRHGRPLD